MTGEQIFSIIFSGVCMIVGLTIIIAGNRRENRRFQAMLDQATQRNGEDGEDGKP